MNDSGGASLRLDRWLWFARLVRTRSLAARLCAAGRIAVEGAPVAKPHQPVRVGDWIIVTLGRRQRRLLIVALGRRRGPAAEACRLYEEPAPPVTLDPAKAQWTPLLDDENWA